MDLRDLQRICAYDDWADERTFEVVRKLTPEEFTRELGGSFPSVRDTLAHIHLAQWIWLRRIETKPTTGAPGTLSTSPTRRRWRVACET